MSPLRRRILLVLALVGAAVFGALAAEHFLTLNPARPFGHSQSGHAVGWTGLAAIFLVFVYSFVKRSGGGGTKFWLRVHMTAGVAGPVLILVHSGAHWHAIIPVLAMASMLIVALSGIAGKTIHFFALRALRAERSAVPEPGLSPEEREERLSSLAAGAEAFRVWQYIHAPMTIVFLALAAVHVAGALYYGGN